MFVRDAATQRPVKMKLRNGTVKMNIKNYLYQVLNKGKKWSCRDSYMGSKCKNSAGWIILLTPAMPISFWDLKEKCENFKWIYNKIFSFSLQRYGKLIIIDIICNTFYNFSVHKLLFCLFAGIAMPTQHWFHITNQILKNQESLLMNKR